MAINKIIINGDTKIDLTQDTATENDVRIGKTFHARNGEIIEGKLNFGYTLREFVEGMEVMTIDDGTIMTDWEDITSIPSYFCVGGCNGKLKTVRFDKVGHIFEYAFAQAEGLENAIFPECTMLSKGAFCDSTPGNGITKKVPLSGEVYFPKLSYLCDDLFSGSGIKIVDFPEVETSYNNVPPAANEYNGSTYVFGNCKDLETVNIPKLDRLGWEPFINCIKLKNVNLDLLETCDGDLFGNCMSLETISLPNAKNLGIRSFFNCCNLKNVYLPNLEIVPPFGFNGCLELEEINLPQARAHQYMSSGMGLFGHIFTDDMGSTVYQSIITDEYLENQWNKTPKLKKVSMPAYDGTIYSSMFRDCYDLEELDIRNAREIGLGAFYNYTKLKNVNIRNVMNIQMEAFYGCSNLETINAKGATTISAGSFVSCSNLKKIIFGSGLTKVENPCPGCLSLEKLIIVSTTFIPLTSVYSFDGMSSLKIYVKDNLVNTYKAADNWVAYADKIRPISELSEDEYDY